MKEKEIKIEETETSHTLCGTGVVIIGIYY